MKPPDRPPLSMSRGLAGAALGAISGAALILALPLAFLGWRWFLTGATAWDRAYDLRVAREQLVFPVLGCAIVTACAGWATVAPAGGHRFARTLALVFLVSLILWWLIGSLWPAPRRYKGEDRPAFDPSEALVVIGPPVVAAALLTVVRVRGRRGSH